MMRKLAEGLLKVLILPLWMAYRAGLIAFDTGGEIVALVPGGLGRIWRRAWYKKTLVSCGRGLRMEWMSVIKTPLTQVGDNVFVGVFCWIGWANVGDDVMLGGHVAVLSGSRQHSFDRTDIPMAMQKSKSTCVQIGRDVWIGNGSVVMADVKDHCVVGAGSIVNKAFAPGMVLAGVPARVIRRRGDNGKAMEKV